jgi:Cu2+-exporting ATPase
MMFFGPLTMLSFLHAASRKGILLKNGQVLERLRDVDTFVFDKTGTLTLEQPVAERVYCFAELTEEEILALAVSAEHRQTHPIALAIQELAKQRGIRPRPAEEVHVSRGFGMSVFVDGQRITLGSERMMSLAEVTLDSRALCEQKNVHAQGHSFIFIARENDLVGAIEIRPCIRPEATGIVAELKRRGKKVFILSGDHEAPTANLARHVGADHHFSQVLPEDKATVIEQMQTEGRTVCFVGDGINDSIALKQADVSISMKGAASIATDVAQIVLMNGNLELLLPLLDMSERFEHYMRVNRLAAGVPAFITLAGTMLLGWGFATAVVLSQLSTPLALYCLVGPAREYPKRN